MQRINVRVGLLPIVLAISFAQASAWAQEDATHNILVYREFHIDENQQPHDGFSIRNITQDSSIEVSYEFIYYAHRLGHSLHRDESASIPAGDTYSVWCNDIHDRAINLKIFSAKLE
jgi:hypothetical protein